MVRVGSEYGDMKFGSLFSGIGGMDLGLERAGMECAWQVEIDSYATRVLAKHWPNVERYPDVRLCGRANLRQVDLIAGGFPCQDISAAGNGEGIVGERSGLWTEFARIIEEIRPVYALVENVPALRGKGLALVLQNLWTLGYDAEWHCIPASSFGAPYERDRIFILAYHAGSTDKQIITWPVEWAIQSEDSGSLFAHADLESDGRRAGREGRSDSGFTWEQSKASSDADLGCEPVRTQRPRRSSRQKSKMQSGKEKRERVRIDAGSTCSIGSGRATTDSDSSGRGKQRRREPIREEQPAIECGNWWAVEPDVVRMVSGVSSRVDRIRGLGNAVIPQVAEWIGRQIVTHGETFPKPGNVRK
jgi:DNA (cytosine-5)-methyltransferase 1